MTSSTVKRSQFATFIDTSGSVGSGSYAILGDGITTGTVNYNPQTSEEIYIDQDSGTIEVESYKPTLPIEATCKNGDEAYEFIDALRKSRAVLDDAKTNIVNVWLYETATSGSYPAEKQDVSVQIDSFGGEGWQSNKNAFTLNFIGEPTLGLFHPTGKTFTPS